MKRFFILLSIIALAFANSYAQNAAELKKIQKQAAKALVNAKKIVKNSPKMTSEADSVAYTFGIAQSNGLRDYLIQMGVDTAYIDQFVQGVMDRAALKKEDKAQFAYIQGIQIGAQIEQMTSGFANDFFGAGSRSTIDPSIVASGVMRGMLGTSEMNPTDAVTQFRTKLNEKHQKDMEQTYGENKAKGEEFLAENKFKEGVNETPTGLQYKIIEQGDGPIPTASQKVKVNYEGRLIDGTVFDSSYNRGEPAVFAVNQVIAGWTEALCLMPVGSKWELYIPQNLAYGERNAGSIPPYSTLIFTVELLSIEQ